MPKAVKYTLGTRLCTMMGDVMMETVWAYMEHRLRVRVAYVRKAEKLTVGIACSLRVAYDLNTLSKKLFIEQLSLCASIRSQMKGWRIQVENELAKAEPLPMADLVGQIKEHGIKTSP